MIAFEPVSRHGVRYEWNAVRPQLERLREEEPQHWMPEDVYVDLTVGQAYLYFVQVDYERKGFLIVKSQQEFGSPVLFVWILSVAPQAFAEAGFAEGMAALDGLARSIGAKRIRHESRRSGWVDKGFQLKQHVYEREV